MIQPKKRTLYRYAVDEYIRIFDDIRGCKSNYRCNDADVAAWNNFIEVYINGNLNKAFITSFIEFGLNHYITKGTDKKRKLCRFSWVFSDSQTKLYKKVGAVYAAKIVSRELKQEFNIKVKHHSLLRNVYTTVRISEERIKQEFFNTKKGLSWCVINTSLYFDKSSWCSKCQSFKECKEILKQNYPYIYKVRGYDDR